MRQGRVISTDHLSGLPNEIPGKRPVIRIETDWEHDNENSFYIEPEDLDGNPVEITYTPERNNDPNTITWGDMIVYDKQDGINKCVIWRGRKFRQRGYSFSR